MYKLKKEFVSIGIPGWKENVTNENVNEVAPLLLSKEKLNFKQYLEEEPKAKGVSTKAQDSQT
jgi:hypothetical protein